MTNQAMGALDVLALGHALIQVGWSRSAYARDSRGDEVLLTDPSVRYVCTAGAVGRAIFELLNLGCRFPSLQVEKLATRLLDEAAQEQGYGNAVHLNDSAPSKVAVLAMFDRAAARIGKR